MLEKGDEEGKWITKDQDHESKPKVRCDQPADGAGLGNRERGGIGVEPERVVNNGRALTCRGGASSSLSP